jgi:hypothetical protein
VKTFEIVEGGRAILCKICGFKSYNPEDIKYEYCGKCHQYHDLLEKSKKRKRRIRRLRKKYVSVEPIGKFPGLH